jgi:peptidoglycan/xylan/chitin deacetylase (PgdA/CDA1 family)
VLERELFERGVAACDALGLRPVGFRPPGGELTDATIPLLQELGFRYCSPEGATVSERDGITILPFQWEHVDAWYYLDGFDGPPSESALREAMLGALDADYATLIFHPFLTGTHERFALLREVLERARDARPLRDFV